MENVKVQITDDQVLILTVDLKQTRGFTRSKESVKVASSGGTVGLPEIDGMPDPLGIRLNLNIYRPFLNDQERQDAEDAKRKSLTGG